jgi:hypothetical protein
LRIPLFEHSLVHVAICVDQSTVPVWHAVF